MGSPERAEQLIADRPAVHLAGWPIVGCATLVVVALCAGAFTIAGGGETGWRALVRTSAKTSLLFFTAAFVASSARVLWRNDATRWLLANRRYVGVSFAASHFVHLLGIISLVAIVPDFVIEPPTLIGGGLAYVFLAAMTATSFDSTAAWLGPRWWKRLHKSGMYYNWFIFFISYLPRAVVESAWYAPFVAVLLAGIGLRAVAWRVTRRPSVASDDERRASGVER
jgi:DMSO/TMAO reductase YedYZ heme-binding membrane subunit